MRTSISSIRGKVSQATAAALRRFAAARGRDPIAWLILCGVRAGRGDHRSAPSMMVGEFRERALGQQRARAGKYRAAAHPSLRPAVRGLRHHRRRRDLPDADLPRSPRPRTFRDQDVERRGASDAEVQGQRAVLYRRRHDLRCRRQADQFVGGLAGAGRQHLRRGLFQDLQIEPAIGVGH